MMDGGVVDLEGYLITSSEDAYCISLEEPNFDSSQPTFWLPRRVTEIEIEYDAYKMLDTCRFTIPEWIAIEKGLV